MKAIQEYVNTCEEVMLLVTPSGSNERLFFHIQASAKGGYVYNYFDGNGCEIDGGTYHTNGKIRMWDAAIQILEKESDRKYCVVRILPPQSQKC